MDEQNCSEVNRRVEGAHLIQISNQKPTRLLLKWLNLLLYVEYIALTAEESLLSHYHK